MNLEGTGVVLGCLTELKDQTVLMWFVYSGSSYITASCNQTTCVNCLSKQYLSSWLTQITERHIRWLNIAMKKYVVSTQAGKYLQHKPPEFMTQRCRFSYSSPIVRIFRSYVSMTCHEEKHGDPNPFDIHCLACEMWKWSGYLPGWTGSLVCFLE